MNGPSASKHPGQFLCSHGFYPLRLPIWISGSYYHYSSFQITCQKVTQLSSSTTSFSGGEDTETQGWIALFRVTAILPGIKKTKALKSPKSNSESLIHNILRLPNPFLIITWKIRKAKKFERLQTYLFAKVNFLSFLIHVHNLKVWSRKDVCYYFHVFHI